MKKTNFGGKRQYSVAMSQETGCIVMIQINPDESLKVMGSLDREQSLNLAHELIAWTASIDKAVDKAVKPKLSLVN